MQRIKNLTKKQKRLILMICALLLIIFAASYTVFIKPHQNEEKWVYMESSVEQGDLTVGVTESGTLDYGVTSQPYELDLTTTDDDDDEDDDDDDEETIKYLQVEEVYVTVGQRISEGDAIMKFTQKSIGAVQRKLTNATTEAEVALAEAKSEYNVSAISARETYDLNQAKSGSAGTTYNQTVEIAQNSIAENQIEIQKLQNEIASYQEDMEDTQENYEDALEDYNDAKAALEEVGTVNQLVTIKFESSYLQAKSSYERAKESLDKLTDGIEDDLEKIEELQKEIETATAKLSVDQLEAKQTYNSATATGSVAGTTYEATLTSLQTKVDEAQTDLDTMAEKLAKFEAFVGDGTVYAQGDGIITEIGYDKDDYLESAGTVVAFATEGDMTISVDVSQEDVVALEVGDPVEIVFSAYEDEIYEGTISSITTTNTSSNSTTVSYPVIITVTGDTSALYGGMTADVTFVTEQHTNTLYVSKKAIVTEDGVDYVYVEKNGNYILQKVETGLSNGTSIEILDGLNGGDTIYIASKVKNTSENNSDTETVPSEETISDMEFNGDMPRNPNMGDMQGNMQENMQGGMQGNMQVNRQGEKPEMGGAQ